jgi:hypothetical protein
MMYFVSFIPNNSKSNTLRSIGTLYLETSSGKGIYKSYNIPNHVYEAIKKLKIVYFGDLDFEVITDISTRRIDGGEYYELTRLSKEEVNLLERIFNDKGN